MGMNDSALTENNFNRLLELEEDITNDLKAVFRIGLNLMVIRDEKLWKQNYKSFEDYCNDRWSKGSNWARKMIKAVEVKEVVPDVENEWQARQLVDLPDEKKVEVFSRAVDEVNDPKLVTGTQLNRIKQSVVAEATTPEVNTEPMAKYQLLTDDYDSCLNALTRVNSIIEGITEQDVGLWLNLDEFRMDLRNLKANIRMAKPHQTCPYCMGAGTMLSFDGNEENCKACHTLGWVPKAVWDEAPQQFKNKVSGCNSETISDEPSMD